jgi:S-adenosylmethionine:tRNA ribosyltransferase-isomerase
MNVSPIQHDLRTDELDYELPPELIATKPAVPRDSARMMVVRLLSDSIEHRIVRDLPAFLNPGDAVVFNTTAVVPARLVGRRRSTSGRVEGLFLEEVVQPDRLLWKVLLKAGGRLRPGDRIELLDRHERSSSCSIVLIGSEDDQWLVELQGMASTPPALEAIGRTPLPPYILKARGKEPTISDEEDRRWYQTIYADAERCRSIAAPTAGLHFTAGMLAALVAQGVERIDITLHVGRGTFQPVIAPTLAQHQMHSEWFEVSPKALRALASPRRGRILTVGTTSIRTLESLPVPLPRSVETPQGVSGTTELLIAPPYRFKLVDGMLTNFHLPRSTLMALVAAMVGLDRLKMIYRAGIERGYRFYSYGDAMLILP